MGIVSVSMSDEMESELDSLPKEFGFSGRSEVIRAGLKLLANDMKQRSAIKGQVDALLVLVHNEHDSGVAKTRHKYNDSIKTQVHNHLANGKCLELFILKGNASKIKAMLDEFNSNKKIEFAKLIVS